MTTELSLTNQLFHVTSLNWTADNWLQLGWCWGGPYRKQRLQQSFYFCHGGCLAIDWISFHCERVYWPLHRNGCVFIRQLHSNGCTRPIRGLCPATGLGGLHKVTPLMGRLAQLLNRLSKAGALIFGRCSLLEHLTLCPLVAEGLDSPLRYPNGKLPWRTLYIWHGAFLQILRMLGE
jgi:hypothetical protein